MRKTILCKSIAVLMLLGTALEAAHFKAGVGRTVITPHSPIWMSGFAKRAHPSEGILHDLWAKALALEDDNGGRLLVITVDLIGLPHEISDVVASRLMKGHGLERSEILLSVSHAHSGPVVWPNLRGMFLLEPAEQERVLEYGRQLPDKLVGVAEAALADLAPAMLSWGHGSASFAHNRRELTPKGVRWGVNPNGPVDHDVPVLKIAALDGKPRAILFGYACHNSALLADNFQINGDYAGFAQIELEQAQPGVTAMFMTLCGADQTAHPRGTIELAAQYGKALAEEVGRVAAGQLRPARPPIRTSYQTFRLDFAPHDRATFEEEMKSNDPYKRQRAREMLKAYDRKQSIRSCQCPVQAVRLGNDLTLLALGGEVVVDYALRLKREFPQEDLIVAGYSNEVMCYIPSLRVLREGGYEPVDSMVFYNQPGPLAENVEEKVIAACHDVLRRTGIPASSATPQ
jgi:neutral ceramidase